MEDLHQLRVKQRLLRKLYNFRGMRQWCVDAGTIAEDSAGKAFEGRHYYYQCVLVHKEYLDA